eukprot:GHVQ01027296.1.p1 GENE.GHVQ01027296.1~~GHVQ01027296.1.p1  ORF type:complete len:1207 (+),score=241.01 GHVQ01027296.1:216-3836(+)
MIGIGGGVVSRGGGGGRIRGGRVWWLFLAIAGLSACLFECKYPEYPPDEEKPDDPYHRLCGLSDQAKQKYLNLQKVYFDTYQDSSTVKSMKTQMSITSSFSDRPRRNFPIRRKDGKWVMLSHDLAIGSVKERWRVVLCDTFEAMADLDHQSVSLVGKEGYLSTMFERTDGIPVSGVVHHTRLVVGPDGQGLPCECRILFDSNGVPLRKGKLTVLDDDDKKKEDVKSPGVTKDGGEKKKKTGEKEDTKTGEGQTEAGEKKTESVTDATTVVAEDSAAKARTGEGKETSGGEEEDKYDEWSEVITDVELSEDGDVLSFQLKRTQKVAHFIDYVKTHTTSTDKTRRFVFTYEHTWSDESTKLWNFDDLPEGYECDRIGEAVGNNSSQGLKESEDVTDNESNGSKLQEEEEADDVEDVCDLRDTPDSRFGTSGPEGEARRKISAQVLKQLVAAAAKPKTADDVLSKDKTVRETMRDLYEMDRPLREYVASNGCTLVPEELQTNNPQKLKMFITPGGTGVIYFDVQHAEEEEEDSVEEEPSEVTANFLSSGKKEKKVIKLPYDMVFHEFGTSVSDDVVLTTIDQGLKNVSVEFSNAMDGGVYLHLFIKHAMRLNKRRSLRPCHSYYLLKVPAPTEEYGWFRTPTDDGNDGDNTGKDESHSDSDDADVADDQSLANQWVAMLVESTKPVQHKFTNSSFFVYQHIAKDGTVLLRYPVEAADADPKRSVQQSISNIPANRLVGMNKSKNSQELLPAMDEKPDAASIPLNEHLPEGATLVDVIKGTDEWFIVHWKWEFHCVLQIRKIADGSFVRNVRPPIAVSTIGDMRVEKLDDGRPALFFETKSTEQHPVDQWEKGYTTPIYCYVPLVAVGEKSVSATPEAIKLVAALSVTDPGRPHPIAESDDDLMPSVLWTNILGPEYDLEDYVVEEIAVPSKGDTTVPVSLVYRKSLKMNGRNPVYLEAHASNYEGWFPKSFDGRLQFAAHADGITAIAHIRGGYKPRGTEPETREDGIVDLLAVAEYLIEHNYTNPKKLAAIGFSYSAFAVAALANQRPDLVEAIILDTPFLDLMNMKRFPKFRKKGLFDQGMESLKDIYNFGVDKDDEESIEMLKRLSPYENIPDKDTQRDIYDQYPNVLVRVIADPFARENHGHRYIEKLQRLFPENIGKRMLLDHGRAGGHDKDRYLWAYGPSELNDSIFVATSLDLVWVNDERLP